MAFKKAEPPREHGSGILRFSGFEGPVEFELRGQVTALRPSSAPMRAAIKTTVEVARQAFRAGEAKLRLPNGQQYRLTVLAHSAGSDIAYADMRV